MELLMLKSIFKEKDLEKGSDIICEILKDDPRMKHLLIWKLGFDKDYKYEDSLIYYMIKTELRCQRILSFNTKRFKFIANNYYIKIVHKEKRHEVLYQYVTQPKVFETWHSKYKEMKKLLTFKCLDNMDIKDKIVEVGFIIDSIKNLIR